MAEDNSTTSGFLFDGPEQRRCTKCRQIKPRKNFIYHRTRRNPAAECYECSRARIKSWRETEAGRISQRESVARRKKEPGWKRKTRGYMLKYKYGMSVEDVERMAAERKNRCDSCRCVFSLQPRGGQSMHVDHCHKTGKVRGLLCSMCNQAAGLVRDNPFIALQLADYLLNNNYSDEGIFLPAVSRYLQVIVEESHLKTDFYA